MERYHTPGVRFEWLDPPAVVTARRTDVAGFVGITARGPLHEAVRVEGWTQFATVFGGHVPQGYLAYAVEGFFDNGGRTCWVVRVADPAAAVHAALELQDGRGLPALRLEARTPGAWAHGLVVGLGRSAPDRFSLTLYTPEGASERWRNLSMDSDSPRSVVRLLNAGDRNDESPLGEDAGSRLVRAIDLTTQGTVVDRTPSERGSTLRDGQGRLAGGRDGLATLRPEHFIGDAIAGGERAWGLAALRKVDEVAIVAAPDLMPKPRQEARIAPRPPRCDVVPAEPAALRVEEPSPEYPPAFDVAQLTELQAALIAHCETLQDRVAVLDTRLEDITDASVTAWRDDLDTSYAALYWPWVLRPDPLGLDGLLRPVPPSGHVAGVYARGDRTVGVHKAPANERLEGVDDVAVQADDRVHGDLNAIGVNVIRAWNGPGIRVAGARTLSTSDPLVRYVNVRRLLAMIEEAVLEDTAWTVFEPNGPDLWRQVDRAVRGFLDRLWRARALDGSRPEEAFFVTCDDTTNSEPDRDAGRLVCVIGVLPPWPAEFVTVRIGRTEATAEVVEATGGGRG